MTLCRDWLATLWSASFKGYPIHIEKDGESGGKRVVIHEFPMRDDPFLEELGKSPRQFDVTAYIVGDAADASAIAFAEVCDSAGPGLLVLPTHGPRLVQCLSFDRERSKDRHGYIAFRLKFVREGAGSALISVPALANAVSIAVSDLASVAGALLPLALTVAGVADFVRAATSDSLILAGVALDGVRAIANLPADLNDAVFQATASLSAAAAQSDPSGTVAAQSAAQIFDIARDIAGGMEPTRAVAAFAALGGDWPPASVPPGATANERLASANAGEVARIVRLAALGAAAEALTRAPFVSRPEAVTARADFVERVEAEMQETTGAALAPVFVALQTLQGATVAYLTGLIADLAPIITVDAPLALPSLVLAWELYQDPLRAREIVARNHVPHPSFMPLRFEALAR
jgi:prophage DNA circulation protein